MRGARWRAAGLSVALLAAPLAAAAPSGAEQIQACLRPVFDAGETGRAPLQCAFEAARGAKALDEGARQVRLVLERRPEAIWAHHTLGNLLKTSGDLQAAAEQFEASVAAFAAADRLDGQVLGLLSLALVRGDQGEVDAGAPALREATVLATRSGDPELIYTARSIEANQVLSHGGDLVGVYGGLREAEAALFPDGPPELQALVLDQLTYIAHTLGWHDEGRATLARSIALRRAQGDSFEEADGLFEALLRREQALEFKGRAAEQLTQMAPVRELAKASGNSLVLARLACMGAPLLPAGEAQEAELRQCGTLSEQTGVHDAQLDVALSRMQVRWPGPEAQEAVAELLALSEADELDADWGPMARFLQARLAFERGAPEQGLAAAAGLFEALDRVVEQQGSQAFQARVTSGWVFAYQDVARELLDLGRPWQALSLVEQARARELREWLAQARGVAGQDSPSAERYARWWSSLAALDGFYREGILGGQPGAAGAQQRLLGLEAEEAAAREAVVKGGGAASAGAFALDEDRVRAALGEGEALLSFQLPEPGFYSADPPPRPWVLAVHSGGLTTADLPPRAELEMQVEQLNALLQRGDGQHTRGAKTLYDRLLAEIASTLPPGVGRLILIADGPLLRLPFAALKTGEGGPLGQQLELVSAPSVRAWLDSRAGQTPVMSGGPAAFAVPSPAPWAGAPWETPRALPPLPGAEAEARAVVAALGPQAQLFVGAAATEQQVKARAGAPLLHLATHAVVHSRLPDRSAVLLSPGPGGGDGRLQPPEILSLPLRGGLVVLSSCQSAQGEALEGEGTWGLAQAFLQAGAGGVLASLWPVGDDEARRFFDAFYAPYARGAAPPQALRQAVASLVEDGEPARVWAAFRLMGDAAPALQVPPAAETPRWLKELAGAMAALLGLILLLMWKNRGARS